MDNAFNSNRSPTLAGIVPMDIVTTDTKTHTHTTFPSNFQTTPTSQYRCALVYNQSSCKCVLVN